MCQIWLLKKHGQFVLYIDIVVEYYLIIGDKTGL